MLLLFYQGVFASAFSDVPIINSAGRVRRKAETRPVIAEIDFSAPLQAQLNAALAREAKAFAALTAIEARTGETLAKATVARHVRAATRQRALAGAIAGQIETLNAALAVETEESDIIFIATLLSEI
jgi:hypothetical protein